VAVDLAQEFEKGTGGHSRQFAVCVFEIKGPELKAELSLLAVLPTPLDVRKNGAARLQGLGSHVPAGSQYLSDLKEGRSHDTVGELSLPQQGPARGVADNVEIGLGVVQLQLLLGRSGGLGVEIKDADLDVKGNPEFVAVQENNRGPRRIQVVEHYICSTDDFGFVVFAVTSKCDDGKRIRQIEKAREIFQIRRTQRELQSSRRHGDSVSVDCSLTDVIVGSDCILVMLAVGNEIEQTNRQRM